MPAIALPTPATRNSVLWADGLHARLDGTLTWWLLGGAAVLFVATMLLAWRALRAPARRVRERRWIVGAGLVLPLAVLAPLAVVNLRALDEPVGGARGDVPVVRVTGRPWWWDVSWDERAPGGAARRIDDANEIVLPVGRPVRLALAADSLIHSLWVPALAGKVDLVPGRLQHLVLQADREGHWRAPCAEFCGQGHAQMVLSVRALAPAAWEAWHRGAAADAVVARDPLAVRGRELFARHRCTTCHAVRGQHARTMAGPGVDPDAGGPDLTHVASRAWLGAGTVANDARSRRAWIADAPSLKPGARMPVYAHLPPAELDALAAYVGSLR